MACLRIQRSLDKVSSQTVLSKRARIQIVLLSNYASLISNIMTALYNMTNNIRELIASDRDPGDLLPSTSQNRDVLLDLLRRAVDEGCHAQDSLTFFEQEVVRALSYPRVIQSLLVIVLGSDWSHREVARTKVPPTIRGVCADLQALVALSVHLRDSVVELQQQFSVARLISIRGTQEKLRSDISVLINQEAWELYAFARSAQETADFIEKLAKEPRS